MRGLPRLASYALLLQERITARFVVPFSFFLPQGCHLHLM